MNSEKESFKILMFPWLAHGHIFPFLELAKKILKTRNFHIYLCTTQINLSSIDTFIAANSLGKSIETIQLHLEPDPDLPPHYHTTKFLPSDLLFPLLKAFQTSQSSFSHILADLTPDLVIYDTFQPWAATLAAALSIPAVHFVTVGAAATSFTHAFYLRSDDDAPSPFPELCLEEKEKKGLDYFMDFLYANVFDFDRDVFFVNIRLSAEVVLLKTCRALEGKYIDYLSSVSHKRIVTVGPLISGQDEDRAEAERSELMQWLDTNPKNSTVYISFGSECFLSEREVAEIAKGLEMCKAKFVWVIRSPAGEEREKALPEGFSERMRERGRVVTGWAPQGDILGHHSVGAFVSHCGWSSVNESVYCGVPVVAMPVRLDMLVDAKMLVGMGIGVEVKRGKEGWYEAEEIGRKIDEVVEGVEMRSRARELRKRMREEEEREGGEVAEVLWQICLNNEPIS